jgi:NAD(P)-dependent dehydrogenase (short-subunit alcohol dehydrogenase family)
VQQVQFAFRDVTVLVAGGASGMGAQVARLFAAAGADVVIADANGAGRTDRERIGATAIVGDISDAAFCDAAVAQAVERTGRLNAVVNAAGIIARKTGVDTSRRGVAPRHGVNAGGVFYLSRAAARHMRAHGGGAVVNFGSIWGELGGRGHWPTPPARGRCSRSRAASRWSWRAMVCASTASAPARSTRRCCVLPVARRP